MNPSINLINDPIPHLLKKLAIPVGTGFFFNTMFNVADTFYGGMISTQALAALSISFPLFFVILAVGAGISMGSTALIGHALGAGRQDEAELYAAQAISFAIIHGFILSAAGLAGAPMLFRLLGASGEYLALAISYMNVLIAGAVFFIGNHVLNSLLNSTGDTKSFRNFLIGGFLLNLLLDPWFIYGWLGFPAMGLAGISLSTIVVHFLGNCYLLTRAVKSGLLSQRSWRMLRPRKAQFLRLAGQGFPASLNMLTVAIGIFVITWFIGRFGKEAVAAYGIGTRIEQILLLPVMGLNIATLTLVAQNSGAGNPERVKETIKSALKSGFSLMAGGTALLFLASGLLMQFFTRDPAVMAAGTVFLRIEALVLGAYVILYINNSALQGLQKPTFALWIGLFRQIAAPVLAFYILVFQLGWGLLGIWWGTFLVTWTAACISLAYTRHVVRIMVMETEETSTR